MAGFADWAKDILLSRGALVDAGESGALTVMLPAEIAAALSAPEWLSLRFDTGPGAEDTSDWLDRLGRLLPPRASLAGARQRRIPILRPIDAASVLDSELVIQNGIYRMPEVAQSTARYYFFDFPYTLESDETSLGLYTVCLNATAGSVVGQPDALLRAVRDEIEDDPGFAPPPGEIERLFPLAAGIAAPPVRSLAAGMEENAARRLARDSERVRSYYAGLLGQIEKRAARHKGDEAAAEKERLRAQATLLDRTAKLEDLARKYAVRIRMEAGNVLSVTLPVREISVRVIRKKAERQARFHWNPALGALEPPWCEGCGSPASPLYLCDDRVHFLCRACQDPCPECGRPFCRACRKQCKCGVASSPPRQ